MEEAQQEPKELEELIRQSMDDDEEARYEVARQIGRMGRVVIPRAIALADDPRPQMREMAAYILGNVGEAHPSGQYIVSRYPDGVPVLERVLETDPDNEVRATAAHALGHQAVPATLPALCRGASHPSSSVRFAAACALGSFYEDTWETEEGRKHKEQVTATLLRLMEDEDEEVRDWATFGIHQGSHDTPAVRTRLFQALDDPCADVRGEAAVGLAEFGERTLIPRLEQLLREDGESSPCYFEAAETLGDPGLLPAVLEGAERWRQTMEEGEEMHSMVTSAIEVLQKIASGQQESAS